MWEIDYDDENDVTAIYWDGDEKAVIDGKISHWKNDQPATKEARQAVAEAVQSAGTPERIRMQFDLNYGFSERASEQS